MIGLKGIKEYELGSAFNIADMKSSAELQGYISILLEHDIHIEDLIQWFFRDYLQNEFNVDCFVINMPSHGSTILEKCRTIPAEMDGIFKQYKMFVKDHTIDRELLEISSNPVPIHEIPSMISKKYAYAQSEDINREQFLLFSDQSRLHYLPDHRDEHCFCDLVRKNKIRKTEFPEWTMNDLNWLVSRNTITVDSEGNIQLNIPKVRVLKDLYDHEVICISHCKNMDIVNYLIDAGDLRCDSSLFSIPEQNYLNYMLNKSSFSNGLGLRNKYIHSTYPTDENQQMKDYLRLLKLMLITVIKINEEFCLVNRLDTKG